jgi:hypothetical protein
MKIYRLATLQPVVKLTPTNVVLLLVSGLPDFSWYKIPKRGKIYQLTTNHTKYPKNITKGRKWTKCP